MLTGRVLYNNPTVRASIIGVEIEEDQVIKVNPKTGKVRFFVREVTQFDVAGDASTEFGVGSKEVEISYDALSAFLTKCLNDAKQQNAIKNGTTTVAGTYP